MPRVVDRCRHGDAVVTAEYCTRALYGAIINMQRMKFCDSAGHGEDRSEATETADPCSAEVDGLRPNCFLSVFK